MDKITKQVIMGSLLGDGCLFVNKNKGEINAKYIEHHSINQKDYLNWKAKYLSNFGAKIRQYQQNSVYLVTSTNLELTKIYNCVYPNSKKLITKNILKCINNFGLLIWYLDDGFYSYNNRRIEFSVNPYNSETKILSEWLKKKFGLNSRIYNRKKNGQIVLKRKDTIKLLQILTPLFYKYNLPKQIKYKLGADCEKIRLAKKQARDYYCKNRQTKIEWKRIWRLKNKERINKKQREMRKLGLWI